VTPATYLGRFHFQNLFKPTEDRLIVQDIAKLNPRGTTAKLFIWGFRPHIYYQLGIGGPSRFPYNLPLRADWSPKEWLEDLEGEVMADPPDFLLTGIEDRYPWVVGNERDSEEDLPGWLREYRDGEFVMVRKLAHMRLYARSELIAEARADGRWLAPWP